MAKILVVDDNVDMLDTLEHLFTFYDYEVLRAENGKEGLEIAEISQPGLIVLDALMPVMNGFETCENLKRNANTRDIPVIFYLQTIQNIRIGCADMNWVPMIICSNLSMQKN
ncbi:MAG: response regulator [Calditrichia bacterium]